MEYVSCDIQTKIISQNYTPAFGVKREALIDNIILVEDQI